MVTVILESAYFAIYAVLASGGILFSSGGQKRTKKIYVLAAFMILALFTGLRWETGTDWESYKQLFDQTTAGTVFHTNHFDLGYVILNFLVKLISADYTFFLLVDSFAAVFLVYYAISGTEACMAVSVLVFYTNYYIAHYMGSNRRILALGLGLAAMLMIYEGRKKKAFLFIMAAFLFHRSALVLFAAYLVPRRKTDTGKMIALLAISAAIGISGILPVFLKGIFTAAYNITHLYIFNSALYHIVNAGMEGLGIRHFMLACIKRALFLVIMHFFYRQSQQKDRLYAYLLNIYVMSACIYFLTMQLGTFSVLTTYFTIVEVLIWGLMYKMSSRHNRAVLLVMVIMLCFVQLLSDFPVYAELYFPYRSIWHA